MVITMSDKDITKDSIPENNRVLVKSLNELKKKTTHTNISMILDYFIENIKELLRCFENGEEKAFPTSYEDIKINDYMKMPVPDPESLQSVILYISQQLTDECKHLDEMKTTDSLLKSYIISLNSLRKRAEHLYVDLVERYQ